MSVRKPSRFFDGLQDNWYCFKPLNLYMHFMLMVFEGGFYRFHFHCFWKKIKKDDINEASVRGLELLKWDDQERIRQKITENQGLLLKFYKKMLTTMTIFVTAKIILLAGIACAQKESATVVAEYAVTGRSKCVCCKKNIEKVLIQKV